VIRPPPPAMESMKPASNPIKIKKIEGWSGIVVYKAVK
jgi:hypothetical protein